MGTIVPRKQKDGTLRYRAQIRIKKDGKIIHSESETFSKRSIAQNWMARREAELEKPGALDAIKHKGRTIGELVGKYREEVSGSFGRTKKAHLKQIEGMALADEDAVTLTTQRLMAHIQQRRKEGAGPSTVANDIIWLRSVFKYAKRAWGIPVSLEVIQDAADVARHARLIGRPKKRDRRPTPEELEKLDAYFAQKRQRQDRSPPMRLIMWFAIYSCRREEEITTILIGDLHEESGTYLVRDLKHPEGSEGNHKWAKMQERGWEVVRLARGDRTSGPLFPYNHRTVGANFTKACKLLGIEDLHLHDLRHEGASRLAEDGKTIPEIQQVTLHESWGSLSIYVNMPARRLRRVDFTPPSNPS